MSCLIYNELFHHHIFTYGLISCVSHINIISPPKLSLNYKNQTRTFHSVIPSYPFSQACSNSSHSGCMKTPILLPGCPGIISDNNTFLGSNMTLRGRLRGITNTGQHVYGAAIIPYGLNPSVAKATRTFRASDTLLGCCSSNYFHASPSDGCTVLSLYLLPFLCHVICFADSSVMYIRWSLGRTGRYRRTFLGILDCFLLPSLPSTSTYLEALHFGRCVASLRSSPLNRTHHLGQEWIDSTAS